MPTITTEVDVDIDLDDFDIEDIIEYALKSVKRLTTKNDQKKLDKLKEYLGIEPTIKVETLDDKLKMEHLEKVFHKYSTSYIEQQLPL